MRTAVFEATRETGQCVAVPKEDRRKQLYCNATRISLAVDD
jgi:hypothetical protein